MDTTNDDFLLQYLKRTVFPVRPKEPQCYLQAVNGVRWRALPLTLI